MLLKNHRRLCCPLSSTGGSRMRDYTATLITLGVFREMRSSVLTT